MKTKHSVPNVVGDCYFLDLTALRPGDVILTASPGHATSEIIRAITNGDFSHAILVMDLPYGIESSSYGVVKFRLDRFAVRDPKNVLVRRLAHESASNFDVRAVLSFAGLQKAKKYADRDVLTALFSAIPRMDQGAFFCSQLVAAAYSAAGKDLSLNVTPDKVTPAMLASTALLESVPHCLQFKRATDIMFPPSFLDGLSGQSFAELETLLRQKVCDKIGPVFASVGIQVASFDEALLSLLQAWKENRPYVRQLDQAFATAILESGFTTLSAQLMPAHDAMFFIDVEIRHAIVSKHLTTERQRQLLTFYLESMPRIRDTNQERDKDVKAYKTMFLKSGLETTRLCLAAFWDAYLLSRRAETAREQAIHLLEVALGDRQAPPSDENPPVNAP